MGMILRIASSRIVGQGDIVGRSGYFSLNLSANSVMRGRLDARRTLKSLVADLRKDKSATDLYGEEGQNGVVLITLKQGTPGMVIRRGNEVAENAKVQHKSSLDLIKTVYIDGEKVDLGTKTIDDLIPAENIEGIEVKKEAGGKGEIYITTKKTKAVEKTIAKGNMKVEGKVVDEQGEPVIGAAVLIEGTTTGSVTDVNGNFVLSVPSKDAVLVVSYIGMATGKVKVQPKLTITLKSE